MPEHLIMTGKWTCLSHCSKDGQVKNSTSKGKHPLNPPALLFLNFTCSLLIFFFLVVVRKQFVLGHLKNAGSATVKDQTQTRMLKVKAKEPDLSACFHTLLWYALGLLNVDFTETEFKIQSKLRNPEPSKIQTGINNAVFYGVTRTVSLDKKYIILSVPKWCMWLKLNSWLHPSDIFSVWFCSLRTEH